MSRSHADYAHQYGPYHTDPVKLPVARGQTEYAPHYAPYRSEEQEQYDHDWDSDFRAVDNYVSYLSERMRILIARSTGN